MHLRISAKHQYTTQAIEYLAPLVPPRETPDTADVNTLDSKARLRGKEKLRATGARVITA